MDSLTVSQVGAINGSLTAGGAKNSVLLLLAASVLATKPIVLTRVPRISDVERMCRLLKQLNIKITHLSSHSLLIDPSDIQYSDLLGDECQDIRTSILFLGALLGRFGRAKLRTPGGCKLGVRPIDLHVKAMKELGAIVSVTEGVVSASFPGVISDHISFDKVTVTGTVNAILAACRHQNPVLIEHVAQEPEIDDLICLLQSMGLNVLREGVNVRVSGQVMDLAVEHKVIPDRIEVGTFLITTAVLGGSIRINDMNPELLTTVLSCLTKVGAKIETGSDFISLEMTERPKALDIVTAPYPGFPTDLQPPWSVLSAVSEGTSKIQDMIYSERVDHFVELNKMGAQCQLVPNGAIIKGVLDLEGATLCAHNLRSAAALVIAACKAEKKSTILQINVIKRGYPDFFGTIKKLSKTMVCKPVEN